MNDKKSSILISVLEVIILMIKSNLLFSFKEEVKKDTLKYLEVVFLGAISTIFLILALIFFGFGLYEIFKIFMKNYFAFLFVGAIYFLIFCVLLIIIKKHLRG